jgi:hypothetical protein
MTRHQGLLPVSRGGRTNACSRPRAGRARRQLPTL